MKKVTVKVTRSPTVLRSISGSKIRVRAVPMVTVRGYISDPNKINKQIKNIELEIKRERQKLYGAQMKMNSKHEISETIIVKP